MIQRNALSLSHPLKMFSHTELMAKTTLTLFTLMTHLYTSWNLGFGNLWFSDIFRGYRNETLARKGLINWLDTARDKQKNSNQNRRLSSILDIRLSSKYASVSLSLKF